MLRCYYCQFHTTTDLHKNAAITKYEGDSVIYFEGRQYSFLALEEYDTGSVVVVETQNGLKVARIIGEAPLTDIATRYIIGLIDLKRFTAIRERHEKIRDLEKAIDDRVNVAKRTELIQHLATQDPKMKELLDALTTLQNQMPGAPAIEAAGEEAAKA